MKLFLAHTNVPHRLQIILKVHKPTGQVKLIGRLRLEFLDEPNWQRQQTWKLGGFFVLIANKMRATTIHCCERYVSSPYFTPASRLLLCEPFT